MTAAEKALTVREAIEREARTLGWAVNSVLAGTHFTRGGWVIAVHWSDKGIPGSYVITDTAGTVRDSRNWHTDHDGVWDGVVDGLKGWLRAPVEEPEEPSPACDPAVQRAVEQIVAAVGDALADALRPDPLRSRIVDYIAELRRLEPYEAVWTSSVADVLETLMKGAAR
ncbi:hypothetical protein NDR87_18895 [Nocardia sp. CDC159]|uniref:Uncharacterized protein n=1 Tax=Nocardia pulmonis TaxID=2951408 RepID=A0A9X2E9M8_9NOCA|nr:MULTISPECIES: hypothetical protein [Nocardia]MCM6776241.1 hypothetical protein [Nocardia pulmonis]MCM6788433.1 hypothetical protein [Nocardia sp. CDC159]